MLYVKQLINEIMIDNSVLYKTMYCLYNDHRKYIFCCFKRNKTVIICVILIKKMLTYVLKKMHYFDEDCFFSKYGCTIL